MEEDFSEELHFQLENEIEKNIAAGMTSEEARYAALRSFGGADQVKEACRDAWGIGFIERTWQDVCYGLRLLAKSPMLVLVATLSLGLGVGSNLTVYSLLKSVLLEGPTARDPEHLLNVQLGLHYQVSYPNYRDIQESHVFAGLAAYVPGLDGSVNWRLGDETKALFCQIVSGNFFEVLGIQAALGRVFTAEEAKAERDPRLVVLSYGFWQRYLGGDPGIIGRVLNLNGRPYTVLGVLPRGYRSVPGYYGIAPEVYLSASGLLVHGLQDRSMTQFELIGRLRDGTSREQVQSALLGLTKHLEQLYPKENREFGQLRRVFALSGPERLKQDPDAAPMMMFSVLLQALVGLVLLIACANVSSLMLAQGSSRRREIAMRVALGAGRGRLVQQLLTESLLLSAFGCSFGFLLHLWLMKLMSGVQLPLPVPVEWEWAPDGRILLWAFLLTVSTTLLCGIAPALKATRIHLVPALKQQESQLIHRRFAMRHILVIGQLGLSLVLLVTAALFLKSLLRILGTDPGFDTKHTLTMLVRLLEGRYTPEQALLFAEEALNKVESVPGVVAASYTSFLPLSFFGWGGQVHREGDPEAESISVSRLAVGPRYFSVMGTPLLRGREFQHGDRKDTPKVAIVNETLVRRLFPNQEPLGKRLVVGQGPDRESREIVGVVRASKYFSLGEEPGELVCQPGGSGGSTTLVARTTGPPGIALRAVKQVIGELDRTAAVEAKTMEDHLVLAFLPSRAAALLLGILAGMGLTLAMVGLYGVMAYTVSRRTQEIGIRMALGASRAQVLETVLRDGLILIGIGTGIGLVVAMIATRPLVMVLAHGINPTDPTSFLAVTLLLTLIGTGACLISARRAANVDPMVALRYE